MFCFCYFHVFFHCLLVFKLYTFLFLEIRGRKLLWIILVENNLICSFQTIQDIYNLIFLFIWKIHDWLIIIIMIIIIIIIILLVLLDPNSWSLIISNSIKNLWLIILIFWKKILIFYTSLCLSFFIYHMFILFFIYHELIILIY